MRRDIFDYDNHKSFWDIFPELDIVPIFAELKKKDTSKNKKYSSGIMWALQLCLNRNSKIYNAPDKWNITKHKLVPENFDWESEESEELIESFKEITMSQAEKTLYNLESLLKERDKFLKKQNDVYNAIDEAESQKDKLFLLKQIKEFDVLLANTAKLLDEFNKAKKVMEDEELLKKKYVNTSDDLNI